MDVAPSGIRLGLPPGMERLHELEGPGLPIVAAIAPEAASGFRANLNLEILAASPALAHVAQLGMRVVAGQLSLGVHVAAYERWDLGDRDGRRIVSVYSYATGTVVEMQFVTLRAGVPAVLTLQFDAQTRAQWMPSFAGIAASLEIDDEPGRVLPDPDPDELPPPDEAARGRGVALERISHIRGLQPYTPSAEPRRAPPAWRRARSSPLRVGVRVQGEADERRLEIDRGAETAVILRADPAPVGGRGGSAPEAIPSGTVPVTLARWLGVAPAWNWAFTDTSHVIDIPARSFTARLDDPTVAAPQNNRALAGLWSERWESTRFTAARQSVEVLCAGAAGFFTVSHPDPDTVRLSALMSRTYLEALLNYGLPAPT